MLIATQPGKHSVLIGILSSGGVCNGNKGAFMRVDAIRTWALSIMGSWQGVFIPQVDFNVTVTPVLSRSLSSWPWYLRVKPGIRDEMGYTDFSGGCGEKGTVVKDQGQGSFLVEFEAFGCWGDCQPVEIEVAWAAAGCSRNSRVPCIRDPKCMWMNEACQERNCSLALSWKERF
jgi:hypothetical protein